ncbi:MAG TPA: hypothetical protein VNM90_21975, partial [Haliangium sp.]|nr:hypothetical protein [Haliangium sp.]
MSFLQWEGARLEGSGWQGIRYLELHQTKAPGTPSTLILHLALAPGQAENVELVFGGGRRVTELRATVTSASSLPAPHIAVELPVVGDHATYTVTLVNDGVIGHAIHPFFATTEFVFTLDCELGDCRSQAPAQPAPEPRKRPPVDLLAKDYSGFVQLVADRIRIKNPHWADLSPASFERVLIELFAHHADMLSYYQDRVANEAFVQTARQRHTLRQHGMLLGYRLNDGRAATTEAAFQVETSGWLPAGLSLEMAGQPRESRVVFYVPRPTRVIANHSRLIIAGWPGAVSARIPAGATELLLWKQDYQLAPGDRLVFVQDTFTQVVTLTAVQPVAQPGWTDDPGATMTPGTALQPLTLIQWREPLAQTVMPWTQPVGSADGAPFAL